MEKGAKQPSLGKTILIGALTFILILLGACGTTPHPSPNSDFEQNPAQPKSQYDWFPTILPQTQEFVDFEWDEIIAHSGEHSVSIAIDPSHPEDKIFYNWTRAVPDFQVGRAYELSGWIQTENLSTISSLLMRGLSEEEFSARFDEYHIESYENLTALEQKSVSSQI